MNEFDEKLKTRAASWDVANAPKGLPTCPNCALREKADPATFDSAGGDFWWCVAKPVLPVFVGPLVTIRQGRIGMPINLKTFDPASGKNANEKACPLFRASQQQGAK
jgi:hypothetical protein